MRDEPVPCINATQYEIDQDKHLTWDDESHCTVCRRILDKFAARRTEAEQEEQEYAMWSTGSCPKCNDTGIMGPGTDAHPSVYGLNCPDCDPPEKETS